MAATVEHIAQLRRMVAEPSAATYSDAALSDLIEARPLTDVNGAEPFTDIYRFGTDTTRVPNTSWIPNYDLNAVAAMIWAEKASQLTGNFDFSADGGSYSRSQAYRLAMEQSRYYSGRRSARTIAQEPTFHRPSQLDE